MSILLPIGVAVSLDKSHYSPSRAHTVFRVAHTGKILGDLLRELFLQRIKSL